MANNMRTVAC